LLNSTLLDFIGVNWRARMPQMKKKTPRIARISHANLCNLWLPLFSLRFSVLSAVCFWGVAALLRWDPV